MCAHSTTKQLIVIKNLFYKKLYAITTKYIHTKKMLNSFDNEKKKMFECELCTKTYFNTYLFVFFFIKINVQMSFFIHVK